MVFVIILFRALPVSAQENGNYSFFIYPQFGVFYGQVSEIVYPPADMKADLLSLLSWDMKPVPYFGIMIEFSPARPMERWRFFFDLSLKFGIPCPSGNMEDRDWMSKENTKLTHFSTHDNVTKEIFILDFSSGVSFPIRNILLIKTFVNISLMSFCFNGENGSLTYARQQGDGIYNSIDDDPIERSLSGMGKVISYSQKWFYAAPGVSLGMGYKELLFAEISFIITPLVLCTDMDEHILTNTQYKDKMKGGIMLEPGFRFSLNLKKWLGISCEISWRYISRTRGPSYNRSIGSGIYVREGEAGAGLSMLNTALMLKVRL